MEAATPSAVPPVLHDTDVNGAPSVAPDDSNLTVTNLQGATSSEIVAMTAAAAVTATATSAETTNSETEAIAAAVTADPITAVSAVPMTGEAPTTTASANQTAAPANSATSDPVASTTLSSPEKALMPAPEASHAQVEEPEAEEMVIQAPAASPSVPMVQSATELPATMSTSSAAASVFNLPSWSTLVPDKLESAPTAAGAEDTSCEYTVLLLRKDCTSSIGIRLVQKRFDDTPTVADIIPDGPAAGTAVQVDDMLLEVNGIDARASQQELKAAMASSAAVTLKLKRAQRSGSGRMLAGPCPDLPRTQPPPTNLAQSIDVQADHQDGPTPPEDISIGHFFPTEPPSFWACCAERARVNM